jgi:hypothetical protein
MTIAQIIEREIRLRPRVDVPDRDWQLWESKTWNIHRGVLYRRLTGTPRAWVEVVSEVREKVASCFRIGWWKGFGFGVLIESDFIPRDLAELGETIDSRASRKGTWQWTVFACEPSRLAVGVHMWEEGRMSPLYRNLLAHYRALGFEAESFTKEMDRLMKWLTLPSRLKGQRLNGFEPRNG